MLDLIPQQETTRYFSQRITVKILPLASKGMPVTFIERQLELPPGTIEAWLRFGRHEMVRLAQEGENLDDFHARLKKSSPVARFTLAYEAAFSVAEAKCLDLVQGAIEEGDLSAAQWWLNNYTVKPKDMLKQQKAEIELQMKQVELLQKIANAQISGDDKTSAAHRIAQAKARSMLVELKEGVA